MSTHDLELAKNYSDRLIMFTDGKITTDNKISSVANLDTLFGNKFNSFRMISTRVKLILLVLLNTAIILLPALTSSK